MILKLKTDNGTIFLDYVSRFHVIKNKTKNAAAISYTQQKMDGSIISSVETITGESYALSDAGATFEKITL